MKIASRWPGQLAAIALGAAAVGGAAPAPVATALEAPGPAGPLRGTMLAPRSPHGPVVLIIPGSGPVDRDGDSPAGIRASTYRLLAEGLAARGVTTIRIDKRGLFGSAAATPDPNAVTIADYVADVRAWTRVILGRTGAPCLWLLGHSEGGLVAMAAARERLPLCGLVLVETAGRPLGEVLRDQLRANPANAPLLGQALAAIDALEAGRRVGTTGMNPALLPLFRPAVQGFLIDAFSYDPARLLANQPKPVLILQGGRDLQVGPADARALKRADPKAKLVLLAEVNHVLKSVGPNDRAANLATYADPGLPLAPGVVGAIAGFLAGHATPTR